MGDRQLTRRNLLKRGAAGGLGLAGLSVLGGADFSKVLAAAGGMDPKLVAAAKKEGHINLITLPRTWANYGEIMDTFHANYGISITDDIPEGSSSQEIQAIQNFKGQSRGPDALDVSLAWAINGAKLGLLTPYKVSTWDTIPANMKDPTGLYVGDYYGVVAFLSVDSIVKQAPKDWSDLTSPTLKGKVALGDDPRKAGEAFAAVFAASLANGGSLDNIEPGINFFSKLKKQGNFILSQALNGNIAKGVTPVAIRWDYLLLAARDEYKANQPMTVNIPATGHYAGPYFQAISKYAPNPNAAKLWEEYLYSDAGQLMWLKGYTHPARFADLAKRNVIPMTLLDKLPPVEAYKNVRFANAKQISDAQTVLTQQWGPKVAGS
jgi:putative spermidine/putrescine transport system substrate-binding protein